MTETAPDPRPEHYHEHRPRAIHHGRYVKMMYPKTADWKDYILIGIAVGVTLITFNKFINKHLGKYL